MSKNFGHSFEEAPSTEAPKRNTYFGAWIAFWITTILVVSMGPAMLLGLTAYTLAAGWPLWLIGICAMLFGWIVRPWKE